MTKKSVLWISLIGVVLVTLELFGKNPFDDYCVQKQNCLFFWKISWDIMDFINPLLYLLVPVFLLSLITYFLREEIFRTWIRFTYWWIPISIFFVYLASGSSGGGFGIPNVLDQESVSYIFSTLFLIISLIIITFKYFTLPKRNK